MVELVPGYGVMMTKKQLDGAEGESNSSPTEILCQSFSVGKN